MFIFFVSQIPWDDPTYEYSNVYVLEKIVLGLKARDKVKKTVSRV